MSANDRQVDGTHYEGELQHWDIVYQAKLDYFQAQILRYIMRHRKKHGLKDLQKAEHFIQKYIELEYPHGGIVPQGYEENEKVITDSKCDSCGVDGGEHDKRCPWNEE